MNQIKNRLLDPDTAALADLCATHLPRMQLICTLAMLGACCLYPGLALAQSSGSLSASATTAVNYIKTGVYFILIVAVLGSAVAAAFGRMEWATVGRVLIGCVVAGLATEVVDGLSGLKGQ